MKPGTLTYNTWYYVAPSGGYESIQFYLHKYCIFDDDYWNIILVNLNGYPTVGPHRFIESVNEVLVE